MFISCNHKLFKISLTLKNLLISFGYNPIGESQKIIFEFSEFHLLEVFYCLIPVVKFTHCYVLISGSLNKNRISKEFYTFLESLHAREKVPEFNKLDKFYTKLQIADSCVAVFKKNVNPKKNDLIIEPSAGNGSFLKSLNKMNGKKHYLDIAPENPQILKQDFFKYTAPKINGKVHVIGNPPFGKQSSIAIKFIKHAAGFADSISFILPKSFKKESLKSKIPLNFHLTHENELPKSSFFFEGKLFNVPCVFQIWKKSTKNRKKIQRLEPENFIFVKQNQNPHLAFCRVGNKAGRFSLNWKDKSVQTHYFIKFKTLKILKKFLALEKTFVFPSNNTVGAKSISKQELILICDKQFSSDET
jgi:hypothetical protein